MVSIAVKAFGVCDFSRLAVTDWRLRRWRLWFMALMTSTHRANVFCRNEQSTYFVIHISMSDRRVGYFCQATSPNVLGL